MNNSKSLIFLFILFILIDQRTTENLKKSINNLYEFYLNIFPRVLEKSVDEHFGNNENIFFLNTNGFEWVSYLSHNVSRNPKLWVIIIFTTRTVIQCKLSNCLNGFLKTQ